MAPRSPHARLRLAAVGMTAALVWTVGARADVLHATYRVSLVGLPIGSVNLNADLTPTSYAIAGDAKLTGLAKLFTNARGASAGKGAIVQGRVSPASFATIASSPFAAGSRRDYGYARLDRGRPRRRAARDLPRVLGWPSDRLGQP